MRIMITGAGGNLGSHLARHLKNNNVELHLMFHETPIQGDILKGEKVKAFQADLAKPESLVEPCSGIDCIIHFAGVLFKPNPEQFLPITNTLYFRNLLNVAIDSGVKRIILISFPHVEGESTPENPAMGRLDGEPNSVHAETRLEEERSLFDATKGSCTTPVSLRLGMVYGKGVLIIDSARWLARHWLLAVWRKPTWIHLISVQDFLLSTKAAIFKNGIEGIYHVGDDSKITIQEFLDRATVYWKCKKPWRLPKWMIYSAAWGCEIFASIFKTRSPLTLDFVRIGMTSFYGDTSRMRKELLSKLTYPTLKEGICLL